MTDTFTTPGGARQIEQYTRPNSWGPALNIALQRLADLAKVRFVTVDGPVTLAYNDGIDHEASAQILVLSGAGNALVTEPGKAKGYIVVNQCAADVTMKPLGALTAATIRAGTWAIYWPSADNSAGNVLDMTLDKIKLAAANVDLNGKKITNLGAPTNPTDASTKKYIDDLAASSDLGTVASIADDIRTLADIQDGTVAADAITNVAAIAAEILLLAPVADDVAQLADMFIGASATDPTTRLDGSALHAGDYYLNTTGTPTVRVYDGSAWIPIEAVTLASQAEAEAGTNNTKMMTPLRTKQAITALTPRGYQEFLTSGTWNKPADANWVYVEALGGGGGGGSGSRRAVSVNKAGGGGGSGSPVVPGFLTAADLPSSVTVTVGAAGIGGASQTTNDSSGNAGSAGGSSSFGGYVASSGGNGGGPGGTTSSNPDAQGVGWYTAGSATSPDYYQGGANSGASAWFGTAGGGGGGVTQGAPGGSSLFSSGSGGGGGGENSSNVMGTGGGSGGTTRSSSQGGGGPGGASHASAPTAGSSGSGPLIGGGGGGAAQSAPAGAGGAGGLGAGGGGGGASRNGFASGAGGNGGAGRVRVWWG